MVCLAALLLLKVTILSGSAQGQARTWNAGTGDWNTDGNWSPVMLPDGTVDVTISNGGTAQLSGSGTARDIVFGESAGSSGHLQISGSGVLTSRLNTIGQAAGSTASVSVSGSTARWTTSGITVGQDGSGSLEILSGADVTGGLGIAGSAGSNGEVTVRGAGSTWLGTGDLEVGIQGSGELNIEQGGRITSTNGIIGYSEGSTGIANVVGTDSTWQFSGNGAGRLDVGRNGTGTLNIRSGGVVTTSGASYVGRESGASGTVNIDGANSRWSTSFDNPIHLGYRTNGTINITNGGFLGPGSGEFNVGYYDHGTLNVSGGGRLNGATLAYIGREVGSLGDVSIAGASSRWNLDLLTIGRYGTGNVNVSSGGVIFCDTGVVGNMAGAVGSVTLQDSTTHWYQDLWLYVGHFGKGTVTVQGGADMTSGYNSTAEPTIGYFAGAEGTVTVDGAGSTWTTDNTIYVARSGSGTLRIKNGGQVSSMAGVIGELAGGTGQVFVETGSAWNNTSTLKVGDRGNGSLTISGSSQVTTADSFFANYQNVIGEGFGGVGTVTVTGAGSKWIDTVNETYIGGTYGTGNLNIVSGGTVSNRRASLGVYPESRGTVTVSGAGSRWTNDGPLEVGFDGTGELRINGGGVVTSVDGFIGYDEGAVGRVEIGSGSRWEVANALWVGMHGQGSLDLVGNGKVYASGYTYIGQNGALSGTGTVHSDEVHNSGVISPGTSPGKLTIDGNLYDSGKLRIEIASASSFDRLAVTGLVDLYGELEVVLLNGFVPTANQSFTILTGQSITNQFTKITVTSNTPTGGMFDIDYGTTGVTLRDFAPNVAGDFNGDAIVDASDYVAWRKTSSALANYAGWRNNFGSATGGRGGDAPATNAPEPTSAVLLAVAVALVLTGFGRRMVAA